MCTVCVRCTLGFQDDWWIDIRIPRLEVEGGWGISLKIKIVCKKEKKFSFNLVQWYSFQRPGFFYPNGV